MNFRLAAPAILLAGLLLLPFLNKPFAIDDPLFLGAAKHALSDPLHPTDFEQVWNEGDRLKVSQFLGGGTLPAYVLAPAAALGGSEWLEHLFQFLLLSGFLVASVSAAQRLGCDWQQARAVGLLIASNPVTLEMASTCMPDVMAMMFAMWGMDRLLLYREKSRWGAGVAAALLFAAAVLCRASTAPLLFVVALLAMPKTWKEIAENWWPLAAATVLVALFAGLNRGPSGTSSLGGAVQLLTSLGNMPRNLVAFLCFQALTGPLVVYGLLTRGWKFAGLVSALVALGVSASLIAGSGKIAAYSVPATIGLCFVVACLGVAGDVRRSFPLLIWLGAGMIALPYVHMAAKYLLPGVPAAALLIVLHAGRVRQPGFSRILTLLVACGCICGALIVVGDTTLANSQRDAVNRLIAPLVQSGARVWACGQWTFLMYAERTGASALANSAPFPSPGDTVVVSRVNDTGALDRLPGRRALLASQADRRCGVFILNQHMGAGFYSNRWGYLPFVIGCGDVNTYDVYRVLP